MEIKRQHSNDVKKDISFASLKIIKNIRFTDREIDVIACLLGGRSYKKIASILSITPKTVEHHVRNIMSKVECNSREGIIDFIEKSDKFSLIKIHYVNILTKIAFEQELKKILPISKKNNMSCLIFHYKTPITKTSFVYQLEQNLNIAGIKTFSKTWVKDKSKGFLINQIGTKQINCIIYALSNAFVEQLKLPGYDIYKEASNLIPLMKESSSPIIFLLLDDKTSLDINKNQTDFTYIRLSESENYYLLFFELLKKVLSKHSIDASIIKFKKQYEMLQGDITLQGRPMVTEPGDIKGGNRKKKKNIFKWSALLLTCFIGFSFAVFKINNKENNLLIYQPQNFESKADDDKQNISLRNRQTTIVFNLPPRNSKFTGRKDFLVQIKKQLDKQKVGIITQAISGLGGVGKTQLATEFAYQAAEEKDYSIIFWIPAETPNAINSIYIELAKFLQIDVRGFGPNKSRELIHNKLAKRYKGSKILFVFDNVPNYENIQKYIQELNKQLLTGVTPHILITSRSQYWPENSLMLDAFTPEEAKAFIKKHLPNENDNSVAELAKTLHYFPLALGQAVAYIKRHTNISDYLKLYINKKKDFLDKFPGDRNQYIESLWKTWNIALTKLSKNAKEILSMSSYLYPDDIPIEFFDNFSIEERGKAIKDLRKHSFIILTNNNKSFKIHRLLQEVIRKTIVLNNKNSVFGKYRELIKADELLKNKFDCSYAKYDTWSLCEQYLNHAQSLAEHEINIGNEFFHKGVQLYCDAAMYLTHILRAPKIAKETWEKILLLIKPYCTIDVSFNLVLASVYTNLSYVTRRMGLVECTKKYLKKAISIYESKISSVSKDVERLLPHLRWNKNLVLHDGLKCDYSFAIANWAHNTRNLTEFNEAINFYTKALKILNECRETKHTMIYKVSFLQTLGELNIYYGNLGTAKKLLDSAKIIADRNFPNHMEQAYVYDRIAMLLYYRGLYNKTKEYTEKVLNIRLAILSQNHYGIAITKSMLGLILCTNNNVKESITMLKQAEIIFSKNFKEHYYLISFYINMSYALEKNREYDQALQYLTKAYKLVIKNKKTYNLYVYQLSPIERLPLVLKTKNISYYQQALNLMKKIFGKEHIRTARYHYLLGLVFENIGDITNAKQHYNKALDIHSRQQFKDKILIMGNQKNIKIIQKRLGKINF